MAEKNSGAICFLSKVAGPCDKKVSNFYYDPNHKDCKHFLYSGCGGNDNRYNVKSKFNPFQSQFIGSGVPSF